MVKTNTLIGVGLLLGFHSAATATPFVLPPACAVGTLASYISLASNGCSVGELGFRNFNFSVLSATGGAIPIQSSAVTVTPASGFTNSGFQAGLFFSSGGFTVIDNQSVSYLLSYSTDPHPIIFDAENSLQTSTPTFPGIASITTNLCVGTAFIVTTNGPPFCPEPGLPKTLNVFHNGINFRLFDSVSFPLTNFIDVRNTIELSANGANANFDSFSNSFTSIPEPATCLFTGSGLLVLWRVRRRRTSL